MDARTGSYMLFKLMKILTPIFKNIKQDSAKELKIEDLNLTDLAGSLFDLPKKEFEYIQDSSLKVVFELLPAGDKQVLDDNGQWGINDIAFDTALVMNLTVQSLLFNLKGFFPGDLLTSLTKGLNTSQQN
jgi:hypothetical protein